MNSLLKRNVLANFVGRGWSAGLNLALIPVYGRLLGVEALGLIGFNALLNQAFNLLDMGLSPTMARETARLTHPGANEAPPVASDDPLENPAARLRCLVRTFELVYWPIALVIAGVVTAASFPLAHSWLHRAYLLKTSTVAHAICLMGVSIAVQWPYTLYEGGLIGLQRQVLLNGIITACATLRGFGGVVVLWCWPTISAFFWWQVIAFSLQTLCVTIAFWSALPPSPTRARFSLSLVADVWRFASAMTGVVALGFVLTQVDKFLLSRSLSLREYAYYTLAWSAAGGIYFIIAPLYSAYFPRFVHAVEDSRQDVTGSDKAAPLAPLYHQACQVLSVTTLPVAAAMIVDPFAVMYTWTGSLSMSSHTMHYLQLMAIGFGLFGLMHMALAMLLAAGNTRTVFFHNLISVALAVPACIYAIGRFGPAGAIGVWIVVNMGYLVLLAPRVHRTLVPHQALSWAFVDVAIPVCTAVAAAMAAFTVMDCQLPILHLHSMRLSKLLEISIVWLVSAICCACVTPISRNAMRSYLENSWAGNHA